MIKNDINWNTIDDKLKNLRFPLTFIYSIIKNQNKINDYDLSLVIRFFFKNQVELTLKYPLYAITNLLSNEFKMTKKVVYDYYSSIIKKYLFFKIIQKFKKGFYKEDFLEQDFENQKLYIEKLLLIFKAHFDSSITGIQGASKFLSLLKLKNNNIITSEIKHRINSTIELFGIDFFKNSNIKLAKSEDFNKFESDIKIKFLLFYYVRVEKYLSQIIHAYELFKIYDCKIKQIISPKPISINYDVIYSDNDSEDINFIIDI